MGIFVSVKGKTMQDADLKARRYRNMSIETKLDQTFWNNRWEQHQMGWDIGYASPPIVDFMNQYKDRDAAILIPGCGNAYEAEHLIHEGYRNVTVIDIAPKAVEQVRARFKDASGINILLGDFFDHQGQYDLLLEQTFFCALEPRLRPDYIRKAADLLKNKGILAGVLFGKEFPKEGPPFGGTAEEYEPAFSRYFNILTLEPCYNSIAPRQGTELFIKMEKKNG